MLVIGAGILPPKPTKVDERLIFLTSMIYASPKRPPKTAFSPTSFPGTGRKKPAEKNLTRSPNGYIVHSKKRNPKRR